MRQFWLGLLQTIARALRGSAGLWERAAQAIERWLVEEREPEPPGSNLPWQWLAAVERREPPVQWLEHVRQRAPEVRFQHYRAASAPPSPAVRRVPAWDAAPRPAAVARVATPAGKQPRPEAQPRPAASPRVAQLRQEALAVQSASQPEGEPDAQSGAAAEAVFAAAATPRARRQAPTFSDAAEVEPDQPPVHSAESKPSALARLLARARLFLSGQPRSTPDGESPDASVWPPDSAPHSGPWPPVEPLVEDAPATARAEPVSSPWPSLPDEAVRGRTARASVPRAGPDNPSVAGLAPADLWPSLPHIPYGVGEDSPAGDEPDVDQRALRRRQRLDDEQRGVL